MGRDYIKKSVNKIKAFVTGGFLLVATLAPAIGVGAQIPQTINYQSRLRTITQQPITASTTIQFSLYNHPTNGSSADAPSQAGPLVWKETYNQASGACMRVQPDSQGYFYVQLGSCTAFPNYINFNKPLYLGVKIESDAEATPRVLLASHPYALNSQRVNSLEATTTATGGQLLALEDDLDFNIATGTFYGGGLAVNGTSTLQNLTFTVATGTWLNLTDYLAIGAIRLDSTGTSNVTSGAYLVGVFDEFDNSNATTVQAVLADLDTAITAVSSTMFAMDLQQVTDNGATTTNRIKFAGATSAGDILPEANNAFTLGDSANRWSDVWAANVHIGTSTWDLAQSAAGELTITRSGGGEALRIETNGNTGIGAVADDFKLQIAGHTGPSVHNTYDLGSATTSWRNIYASGTIYGNIQGDINTDLAPGSVVFASTSGALIGDSDNLYWDDANKKLGVGTSTIKATARMQVDGNLALSGDGQPALMLNQDGDGYNGYQIRQADDWLVFDHCADPWCFTVNSVASFDYQGKVFRSSLPFEINYSHYYVGSKPLMRMEHTASSTADFLQIATDSAADGDVLTIDRNGRLGLGTSTPEYAVDVVGDARLDGQFMLGRFANLPVSGFQDGSLVYKTSSSTVHYWDGTQWRTVATEEDVRSSLWDTDHDTGVQVEESADEDVIRFDTAGLERMYIANDGKIGVGTTDPLSALFTVGPGAHEASVFSVSGDPALFNIANFRDEDGESIFRANGSVAGNDLLITFGDKEQAGNGTYLGVDYANNSINLSNSEVRFLDLNRDNYVALIAPTALTTNTTYILPYQDGVNNQVLVTDGAGNLSWATSTDLVTNIYTADGDLTGDRTVSGDGVGLGINTVNGGYFEVDVEDGTDYSFIHAYSDELEFNVTNPSAYSGMVFNSGGSSFTHNESGSTTQFYIGSNITITDSLNNRGAEYAADYSANFIDRSLVDKAYVDSAITSSSVAAGNGLTLNSGVMNLGGTLTQTTYIDHMGYDLVVREFAGEPETLFAGDNFKIQDGGYEVRFGIGGPTSLGISLTNPSSTFDLFTFDSYVGAISDRTDFEGIVYDKDYSSYFQNHSLVDKAYVDALVTGTASGLTFQDVADNTIAADGYVYYETGAAATEDDGGAFKIEALPGGYEVEMAEAGGTKLNFKTANGLDPAAVVFYDARATTTGIEYGADYSADFTNRSLVDKEYVDGLLSSTTLQTAYNGGGSALGRQIFTTGSSTPVEIINPGTDQWETSLALTNDVNGGGIAFQTMDAFGDWGGRFYLTDDTSDPANGSGGFLTVDNTAQAFEFGYQTAGTRDSNFYIDYNQMSLNVPGSPTNGALGITAVNYNVPIMTLRGPTIGNNIAFHVGTSTPEGAVTADSGSLFSRTDAVGGNEQLYVKTTDGGNTGWTALSGAVTSVAAIWDTDHDTGIQVEESPDEDIIRFDTAGIEYFTIQGPRLSVLNSGDSIFFGDNAGRVDDLSNRRNVYVGNSAGYNSVSGRYNAIIGYEAVYTHASPNNTTALGYQAGRSYSGAFGGTMVGYRAGYNSSGNNNVMIGYESGMENTGSSNFFMGRGTGWYNDGDNNIMMGYFTGYDSSGSSNIFFGVNSGYENSGNRGIFLGESAGRVNIGDDNIFMGYESGRSNATGTGNLFLGRQAGYSNVLGSGNIFLGYQAGYNETNSNRLYIENSNSANPLVYGEFDNDVLRVNGALQVNNPSSTGYAFPTTDGTTDGLVLATDANGSLYWASSTISGVTSTHWQKNTGILSPQDATVYRVDVTNNSASTLTGFKAVNTNDVSNYAGAVLELKGSGADYTNNLYFGKYGSSFYVPSWAGNGVLATDKNLVIGAVSSSSLIRFQVGGGYTAPNSVATIDSDSLDLLAGIGLNVGGNTVLGDATSDTVTFNAGVNSDILPSSNLAYNFGSSTARWNSAWVATMHIGTSTYELAQSADQAFTIVNSGQGEFARIDNTGRFGVGTQQPEKLISTTGDILIGQFDGTIAPMGGYNRELVVRATDGQLAGIQGTAYTTYQRDGANLVRVGLDTSNNINFGHYDGAWNTDAVIATTGNMGIGTSAPTRRLDVRGGTIPGDNLFRVAGGANGAYVSMYASTTDDRNSVIEVQRNLDFYSQSNHILSMAHTGNVGIGIFNPLYKLDVAGDVRVLDELLLGQYNLNPASGLQAGSIIYNTASSTPFFWNGSDWKAISYSDVSTLDAAYDAGGSGLGRQINTDSGAVYLTGAGNGTALQIDYSGSGQGVAMNNSGSGSGITVGNTSVGTSFYARNQSTGRGFWVDNNAGGQGLYIDNGYGGTGQHIVNDGTGVGLSMLQASSDKGIYLRQNSGIGFELDNNTANEGMSINNRSSGDGLAILNDGNNGDGIRIDNDTSAAGLLIEDTAGKAAINISKPEGTGDLIYMTNQGTGDGIEMSHTSSGKAIRIANTGTGDSFYITDEASDSTPFVLNASGNLGLDQANPITKLDIGYTSAGSSADYGYMRLLGSGDVEHLMYLPTGSNLMVWDFNNTGNGGAIEFRNHGSRIGMFTNTGLVVNDGGLSGVGLRVEGNTNENLIYTHAGNDFVGIGTDKPEVLLHARQASSTVAAFDRRADDGVIVSLAQDGSEEGTISVSGNTISYNAFTGSHYAWTDENIEKGMLVSLTGENRYLHDDVESELLYGIRVSTEVNDPQIMGSYLALQESSKVDDENNPHLVMAVGNGEVWVTDKGENINVGDYLISSDVAGHAQKDTGEFAVSHIVARAAESVDWTHVSKTIDGVKHKKISVFFEAFDKNNMHSSIAGTSLQGGDGSLEVVDLVVGSAVFNGTITVMGHVAYAEDTVGQALIMTGDKRVSVEFAEEYGTLPIVTITPAGKVTVPYWVENTSLQGFDIVLDEVQYEDILFSWHAFGNVEGRVYVSNGTTMEIEVNDMGSSALETDINSTAPQDSEMSTSTEATTEVGGMENATSTEDVVEINDSENLDLFDQPDVNQDTESSTQNEQELNDSDGEGSDGIHEQQEGVETNQAAYSEEPQQNVTATSTQQ